MVIPIMITMGITEINDVNDKWYNINNCEVNVNCSKIFYWLTITKQMVIIMMMITSIRTVEKSNYENFAYKNSYIPIKAKYISQSSAAMQHQQSAVNAPSALTKSSRKWRQLMPTAPSRVQPRHAPTAHTHAGDGRVSSHTQTHLSLLTAVDNNPP